LGGILDLGAYSLRVYGRVQRVGFRRYVLDSAQDLGLVGHVKNLPDGSVEIFVQGEDMQLSKFLEMMRQPPPPTLIRELREEEAHANPEVRDFRILYGELAEELQEGFGGMQLTFTEYWREFRDYRQEFRDFANRTDENFRLMSDRYGEISQKLTVILETLIRESKETREMLNETMKSLKEALERLPR